MAKPIIKQTNRLKIFRSRAYNYTFDLRSGHFMRWASKPGEHPTWSPFGPETLDIEVATGAGCPVTCAACYKKNNMFGSSSKNMSFETFESILNKLPYILSKDNRRRMYFITQINFGITSVAANPELFDMFDLCREHSIVPNIVINGSDPLTDVEVQRIADTCGNIGITLSLAWTEKGIELINRFGKAGAQKVDIHYLLSVQSADFVYTLIERLKGDDRMKNLNQIIFLGLKPKGRGETYDVLPGGEYIRLVKFLLAKHIQFRWDTCSAPRFEKAIIFLDMPKHTKELLIARSQRCTASLFSGHIDVDGKYWSCAFGENIKKAGGLDVMAVDDFYKQIWLSEPLKEWRNGLRALGRECALFESIHSNR